jgi:transcriptional antiterminator RfaH
MQPVSKQITKAGIGATNLRSAILLQKKKWYAIYTRPHHEKKIYQQLQKEGIESYLPLQTIIRQWSDRKKKVSEPLFSCYLFVHITLKDYYSVLNTDGVVRYVTFEGKAVIIPEKQIQLIKNLLGEELDIEEYNVKLGRGSKVEIKSGPFTGLTGELIQYANNTRVILQIEEINKALLVNIPLNYLKQII